MLVSLDELDLFVVASFVVDAVTNVLVYPFYRDPCAINDSSPAYVNSIVTGRSCGYVGHLSRGLVCYDVLNDA